jgi:hypothetical protein
METQGQLVIQIIIHDPERERSRKLTVHRCDCSQIKAIEVFTRFKDDNPHMYHMFAQWVMYPVRIK